MRRNKPVRIPWNATRKSIKVTPHDNGMFYLYFRAHLAVLAHKSSVVVQSGFITAYVALGVVRRPRHARSPTSEARLWSYS